MKEQRKNELLGTFPGVPQEIMNIMLDGKCAENFVVLLTRGHELYARCYHRYSKERVLAERQRYVFATDGAVRYGESYDEKEKRWVWRIRRDFREPFFYKTYFGSADNTYTVLNEKCISKSDLRYCPSWNGAYLMEFLRFYIKHPNVEYLFKAGYEHLIIKRESYYCGYYMLKGKVECDADIDWDSNNLLKMLRLNRSEFRLLRGRESDYKPYIHWRGYFPKMKPEDILTIVQAFNFEIGSATVLKNMNNRSIARTAEYLIEQDISSILYRDYLQQCQQLHYNLEDTAICFPKDFHAMHTRLSEIIKYEENEKKKQELISRLPERKKFEFLYNDLMLIQPKSMEEIIREGRILHHCVGAYAERHAEGDTNIFFIRKSSDPETPYFTIEVSNEFHIRQCHGYKNDVNGRPSEIDRFVEQYKKHLEELKNERDRNKRAV